MSLIDLNCAKARIGSLSPNARKRIANANAAAFVLLTVDLPAIIAELEALRIEAKEFYCGAEPPEYDP